MKVLLTGGAGYLGNSVAHALASRPEITEIVILDNFARQNYGLLLSDNKQGLGRCRILVDDILNSRGLRRAMDGVDCVCHLAALAPSPFSDDHPHAFDQINHWGTAEVVYAAEELGVERFVYVSSGAVYGFGERVASHRENVMPVTSYGASKLDGERHVERFGESRSAVILRSGTIYGVNASARFDTFINKFVLHAALGKAVQIHGDGNQQRPVVQVDAIANVVASAALGQIEPGVYDAVERNSSVNDIVDTIRSLEVSIESIYLNQQHAMRHLKVDPDARLSAWLTSRVSLKENVAKMLGSVSL